MNDQTCERETAILQAARADKWEPSLRAHLDSCAVCREAVKLAQAMNSLAVSFEIPPTPDPQRVWLKAAFAERQKRQARVARFVGVSYAVLVAALGLGVNSMIKSKAMNLPAILPTSDSSSTSITSVLIVIASILFVILLSSPSVKRLH